MRTLAALGSLVAFVPACNGGGGGATAVVPVSIEVSANRRTLTVETNYPRSLNCGKLPGGLDVNVDGGVALVTAVMKSPSNVGDCTGECASVTQTVTLGEPLPNDVRFEAPPDADQGCGVPPPED